MGERAHKLAMRERKSPKRTLARQFFLLRDYSFNLPGILALVAGPVNGGVQTGDRTREK